MATSKTEIQSETAPKPVQDQALQTVKDASETEKTTEAKTIEGKVATTQKSDKSVETGEQLDPAMAEAIAAMEIEPSRIVDEDELEQDRREEQNAPKEAARQQDDWDEVARNTSFYSYTVAKASKAKRKELYANDSELRREDAEQKTMSEGAIKKMDYLDLSTAANANRVLTGEVVGVCNADTNGNENSSTVMAEIKYGHDTFGIYIPSYLFFDYEMKRFEDANDKEEIKTMMAKYIGAEIMFCVSYVDEKKRVAYGDRLKACAMRSVRHYKMPEHLNDAEGLPKFFAGCIAEGTVIYTSRQSIIVDVGGADVRISVGELDYSYIKDARDLYEVGQSIRLKILQVEEKRVKKYNNPYTLFNVTGSVKQMKKDNRPDLFTQFKVGGIYKGTIIEIIETGIFVKLKDKYDCLVAPPKFGPMPVVRTSRQVRITKMDPETYRIFGTFISK